MSEYVCVAVVGARLKGDLEKTFTFAKFCEHMDEYILKNGWDVKKIKFVSGGAKGVDTFARRYCHTFGTPENMIELIPEWTNKVTGKYDKLAGLKRNTDIVEKCTQLPLLLI